jgi:hypothetical protein
MKNTGVALGVAAVMASGSAQAITRTSSSHMGPAAAESAFNSFMSEGGAKVVAGKLPEYSMAFTAKQPYSNSSYAPQQGAGYTVNTPTITSSLTAG